MQQTGHRVLLVDDDESILEVIEAAFRRSGHEVLVARDGSEALVRAERDAPDLVVLDLVMPRRSGFAVLDRLRQRHASHPPIIIVTANTDPRYEQFAKEQGANVFLRKPFDVDKLLEIAGGLLESADADHV
ncbi:MAG: response regulator [Planctomycetaceae bacterium]